MASDEEDLSELLDIQAAGRNPKLMIDASPELAGWVEKMTKALLDRGPMPEPVWKALAARARRKFGASAPSSYRTYQVWAERHGYRGGKHGE